MWLEMDRIQIFGTIWALLTVIVIVTSAAELDGIPRVYKCPILGAEQETLNISKTFKIRQYYDVNGTVSNNESGEFRLLESPGLNNCSGEEVTLNTTKDGVQFSPEGYLRWLNGDRMIYSSPEKYCIQKYEEGGNEAIIHACMLPCSAGTEEDEGDDLSCIQKCCPTGFSMGARAVVVANDKPSFECVSIAKPMVNFLEENATLTQLSVAVPPQARFNCTTRSRIVATGQDALLRRVGRNECVDHAISDAYPEGIASFTCEDAIPKETEVGNATESNAGSYNATLTGSVEPYQEFMYKCGPEVEDNFWTAPPEFRMAYGKAKIDHFANDLNYFPLYNFTLKERSVECSETFTLSTSINLNVDESGPNLTTLNFTPNGYLTYIYSSGDLIDEIYYHKKHFCVANISKTALTVKACKSTCYHLKSEKGPELCVPKCCPFGWAWDRELGCQEVNDDWIPSLYTNRLASEPLPEWEGVMKYVPPDALACYNDSMDVGLFPSNDARLLTNGKFVRRQKLSRGSRLRWTDHASVGYQPFCIDAFGDARMSLKAQASTGHVAVVTCKQTADSVVKAQELKIRHDVYQRNSQIMVPVVYFPCALIYVGILVVYVMLWEKQSSHGWTVMAFSLSQLALYLVLMTVVGMAIYSNLLVDKSMHYFCNVLGIMHNFAFVSTYSWTAVLTFDVWAKLSSMTQSSRNSKGRKRFFYYTCFGVAIPTVIVSIASAMEWAFWEFNEDWVVMPGYSDYCVVTGREAFVYYQGLPSAILFGGNLVFLALTFRSLWNTKKKVEILKEKGSKSKQSSFDNKMILIGKLMLMMGAFLIFEFIFNFAELIEISIYFTFLQVYRILHAAGLFYLFVCSKKVTKQLREKYPTLHRKTVAKFARRPTMTETMFDSTVSKDPNSGAAIYSGKQFNRTSIVQFFKRPRSGSGNA